MLCPKCGAEIPDGSVHCSSCGAKISGEGSAPGGAAMALLSALIKADPAGALTLAGSFLIILGTFLNWATWGGVLGVMTPEGAVICLIGVFALGILVLARSGAAGAWNVVMLLLSALALALVFQAIYAIEDDGAGVWVTMVGALVITAAALLQQFGTAKK